LLGPDYFESHAASCRLTSSCGKGKTIRHYLPELK
jgi:hypothetical protein